ncbi:hypothetical protein BGZ95_010139 [Linnemannia exigua]|uniref:Uncharacterized protein n=1 Tax=Linnemannia exigua TaxID=604196 RepID=A0AAD4DBT9_9FUNG|nr:hypothetical protein BGZ95_010139 [Linnemannia exigua]
MSPVKVNLLRPRCFCGLTSVSIYPEPPIDVSAPKTVHKSNWVYECHYTPKQKNMARPDPCDDCEDERRRRSIRVKELKASNATTFGAQAKPPFRIRHQAEQFDQVELWPRRQLGLGQAGAIETIGEQVVNGAGKASAAPVGADLGRVATFNGLSSSDSQKVCGFHMHALEWHHMQTTGVDAILSLAKQTGCEEFNLSVVRWLGDKVRTHVANNDTVLSSTATTLSNTYNIRTNANANSMGIKIKLYANINCECGSDTVIVKGPTIPSPYRLPSKEKQFLIVCRKRALASSSLEIVESSLRDVHSGYHGYDHRVNRSRSKPTTDKVGKCISSISIDTAVFWCHYKPIHSRINNNKWLSQWLSPPQPPQPAAASRSRSTIQRTSTIVESATKRSLPTTTQHNSSYPMMPMTLHSRSTSNTTVTPLPLICLAPQDYGRFGQPQSSSSLPSPSSPLSPTKRGPTQELPRQLAMGVTDAAVELGELDRNLEETVAWHVAAVTSIMDAQDSPSLLASMSTPNDVGPIAAAAELQYTNYKEINMEEMYPSIAMHLCQQCKDSARDFCVVPLSAKNQHPGGTDTASTIISTTRTTTENHWSSTVTSDWSPPSSPQQSPDIHLLDAPNTCTSTYWTPPDAMVDNRELERLDRELEMVDRELEWVMKRHSGAVLEAMDVRSRLVPGLLLCRGCEYHATVRDVLPCCHALLCIDCVHRVEFYLVPRANTWTAMA